MAWHSAVAAKRSRTLPGARFTDVRPAKGRC